MENSSLVSLKNYFKKHPAWGVVIVVGALLLLSGFFRNYSSENATSAQVVDSSASWHTAFTYKNNTDINTSPFDLKGSKWRVTYSCSRADDSSVSTFFGSVDASDGGPNVNVFVAGANCPTTNTSYIYGTKPGQYFLELNTVHSSYTVTVEDYY